MSLSRAFIVLLVSIAFMGAIAKKPSNKDSHEDNKTKSVTKRCGDRNTLQAAFKTCVVDGRNITQCKSDLKKQILEKCGELVDSVDTAKLQGEAARKKLAQCKMAKKLDCEKMFRAMVGKAKPADARKAKVLGKLEAARGAKEAIVEAMEECAKTSNITVCKDQVRKKLENLKMRNYTKAELAGDLRSAGKSAAGTLIKACVAAAGNSAAARKACFKSAAARKAFAKAAGCKEDDVKDFDLKKAAKEEAMKDLKETLEACIEAAGDNATAKKTCFKRSDLKTMIADSEDLDPRSVKDSKVFAYIAKSAHKHMLMVLSNCNKTADMATCKAVMKDLKAQAMSGKNASNVSDDVLNMDVLQALRSELAEKMTACMEEAKGDNTTIADCKAKLAKAAIKLADMSGRDPSKRKVESMLQSAARAKAKEIMADCEGNRTECMKLLKDRLRKVLGKGSHSQVSTKDVELLIKDGAIEDIKDSAMACVQAKEDNVNATCDDLYTKYLNTSKKGKPTSKAGTRTDKALLMVRAAAAYAKNVREVCYDKGSKAEAAACLKGFKKQSDAVARAVLQGKGGTKNLAARKKQAESDGKLAYLGEHWTACLVAAVDATEKKSCTADLARKMDVAGVTENTKNIIKKYQAKRIASAATACASDERKACLASAKKSFVEAGMKARAYNNVKKLGELMSSAEVYAACKQAEEADSDTEIKQAGGADKAELADRADEAEQACESLAQTEFETVSGADAAAWRSVKSKVLKLGQAIIDGADIVIRLRKQLSVDAKTTGISCDQIIGAKLVVKVKALNITPAISGANSTGCRMVDGEAEYSIGVGTEGLTENQTEAVADAISAELTGSAVARRLRSRFLSEAQQYVSVVSAYVAQETDLCLATDRTCGEKEAGLTGVAMNGVPQQEIGTVVALVTLALMRWA